jgi:hypothetical protein
MDTFDPAQIQSQPTLSRRRLLQGAIAGAVALSATSQRTAWAGRSAEAIIRSIAYESTLQCATDGTLGSHVFATVAAIGAQIIPSVNEHGALEPGASEACTTAFIELNASGNSGLKDLLIGGVAALDAESQTEHGADFVDLTFADQTALLQEIEAGPASFTQALFNTCRSLHKTAWLINWPEAFVRDQGTGQPIFSDDEHRISDPDVPGTGTGWEVVGYHVINWEVEQLLWAWQAGLKVTGFAHGWPTFDKKMLSTTQRQAARDQLYALSDQGLA